MLEIKKGCWYACIKDIEYEDAANIMFSRGRLYWAPADGYLPSNDGVLRHGIEEFTEEYFRKQENEPEMTAFEAAFFNKLCEWQGLEGDLNERIWIAIEDAKELYAVAKKQMREDYVVLDPAEFADIKQFNYDSGKYAALGGAIKDKLAEAKNAGYEEALRLLPVWKRLSKTIRVDMDKYTLFRDAIMSPDGYYIELTELSQLPKEV